MKKLKLLFIVAVATMFISNTIFAQEFIYYTPKEYLFGEINLVEIIKDNLFENPEFVGIVYKNNYTTIIEDDILGDIAFNSDLDLDDMNANVWIYVFRDGDNPSNCFAAAVINYLVDGYFEIFDKTYLVLTYPDNILPDNFNYSMNNAIPLDFDDIWGWKMYDATVFIEMLKGASSFVDLVSDTDNLKKFTLSLQSYDETTFGMDANNLYWISIVESGDSIYVCYIRAERVVNDFLHCSSYVSIKENTIATHLTISPNPINTSFKNDNIITSFGLLESSEVTIEICDLLGECFYNITNFYDAGDHSVALDIKGIPSGNYICRMLSKGKQIGSESFVVGK